MLGERLKAARTAAGKSQEELAKEIGITQVAYSYIERGFKNPCLPVAVRIAEVLCVSLDYLVGLKEAQ